MGSNSEAHPRDEISEDVLIKASPSAVWARITRFDEYATWGAPIRLEGEAAPGGRVTYGVMINLLGGGPRWTYFAGRVRSVEPESLLVLAVGPVPLLTITIRFELARVGHGCRVLHSAAVSGWFTVFRKKKLLSLLGPSVRGTAAALLNRTPQRTSVAVPDIANRKARRSRRKT